MLDLEKAKGPEIKLPMSTGSLKSKRVPEKKIYFCFIDYTKAFGRSKHRFPTTQEKTHGNHQMVNTEIRLIIFFAAKDGEALYSQQKQDRELTVAQIMNSLLPNSDLNWRK